MNPFSSLLAPFTGQLSATTKVGDKVIFTDFSKSTPTYTEVTGGVKKKVTFQEILNYGTQLGGLAVNIINALKSPGTAAATSSASGLTPAELTAASDLKAQSDEDAKAKQRQYLIIGGVALLLIIGATIIFKSKK